MFKIIKFIFTVAITTAMWDALMPHNDTQQRRSTPARKTAVKAKAKR